MNYVTEEIIKPKIENYFTSLKKEGFKISHCVGIDTSSILAVRAGQRGSNDLVWVGRAPNLAAKLSDVRDRPYNTYITEDVFSMLKDSAKYGGEEHKLMWDKTSFQYLDESISLSFKLVVEAIKIWLVGLKFNPQNPKHTHFCETMRAHKRETWMLRIVAI